MNYTGKVYVSKLGLRFGITAVNRPKEDDVVFFTQAEYDWVKQQNLDSDSFAALYKLKSLDHTYDPRPPEALSAPAALADKYGPSIREMLRSRGARLKTERKEEESA